MSSSRLVGAGALTALTLCVVVPGPRARAGRPKGREGGAGFQPAKQEAGYKPAPRLRADKLVAGARTVLAAVVEAADQDARLPARGAGARPPLRRTGDELGRLRRRVRAQPGYRE